MNRFLLPLGIFAVLVGFLYIGLGLNPREVPSPLVGRPAPQIRLAQLHEPARNFSSTEFKGKVWLLNVWASWCVSCLEEHPLLVELSRSGTVPIVGLNYKDKRDDALAWLKRHGDPYMLSVMDADGRTGIDFGVYGVPETFVIDKDGVVRFKQIGPLTAERWRTRILPLVKELQG